MWSDPAATSFVKVPRTISFASITTVEQIQPLYEAGKSITSDSCEIGDVFVVKTDQNKFAAIEIVRFDETSTGTCNINYAR